MCLSVCVYVFECVYIYKCVLLLHIFVCIYIERERDRERERETERARERDKQSMHVSQKAQFCSRAHKPACMLRHYSGHPSVIVVSVSLLLQVSVFWSPSL